VVALIRRDAGAFVDDADFDVLRRRPDLDLNFEVGFLRGPSATYPHMNSSTGNRQY
jgi:hypothetical protein